MIIAQHPFSDDRGTGYKFGDPVYENGKIKVYHPGHDYNSGPTGYSDLGMPVKPYASGKVVYSRFTGSGWGNLLVIYHPHLKIWSRIAHFHRIFVKVGQRVDLDTVIGLCGKTGTKYPHVHGEIILKELPTWTWYPNYYAKDRISEFFMNPFIFVEETNKKWNEMLEQIPDWSHSDWIKSKEYGFKLNPFEEIDINKFQEILKETGTINEVGPIPAYRFMVILGKMGIL